MGSAYGKRIRDVRMSLAMSRGQEQDMTTRGLVLTKVTFVSFEVSVVNNIF